MSHVLPTLGVLLITVPFTLTQTTTDLNYIGQFKIPNPSFVELLELESSGSNNPLNLDLVVTHFAETGRNGVSSFNNIGYI